MLRSCEIVIVGLGAMGAAAAYQLSKHDSPVVAFEQFSVGHSLGSSHGESRIIRQACFEHPSYAPLSLRAYELLNELDARTGDRHFVQCGGLMIGSPDSAPVAGSVKTADQYNLPYDVLEPKELRQRFPPLSVPDGQVAFFEAKAGAAFPEKLLQSWTRIARASGVQVYEQHRVTAIEPHDNYVQVRGESFAIEAGQVIITVGPWMDMLFPEMRAYVSVERIVQHWFRPPNLRAFLPDVFPVFYWDLGPYQLYGFPCLDPRREFVKVGLDNDRHACRPNSVRREVTNEEISTLDAALGVNIPALCGSHARSEPCLWTVSQDRNFIVGRHPVHQRIIVAGGCSGRGFKFAPVIGEILAQLALTGTTDHDITLFSPERIFSATPRSFVHQAADRSHHERRDAAGGDRSANS
jgi:sarcosine oxidase